MSFEDLLIQVCDVERFTQTGTDDYGNPVKSWAVIHDDEPCRLTSGGGREIIKDAQVVIADYKLFIGDVDITEQDRVVISGITYEVLLVEGYSDFIAEHHKQCFLQVVR